jgi:predicted aspartyl protease
MLVYRFALLETYLSEPKIMQKSTKLVVPALLISLLTSMPIGAASAISATKPIGETALLALDGYYACVEVLLKDGRNYPFIVDTGASQTLVLEAFDAAQGFRVLERNDIHTAGARSRAKRVDLGEVIVGGARWPQIYASVIPIKQLPCAPGVNAVGALGMDFLGKPVVEFDFPAQRMRLYQPKTFRYLGNAAPITILKRSDRYYSLRVPATVTANDGQRHDMRFTLDTGAPSTQLTLAHPAALELGLFDNLHLPTQGGGASGERYERIIARVPEVQFGIDRMSHALVASGRAKHGVVSTRNGDSGLLGLHWAKHRRWILNYPAGKIWVEAGEAIAPQKQIGANMWFEQDQPDNPNSPWKLQRTQLARGEADKDNLEASELPSGLELGDVLIAINGVSMIDAAKKTDVSPWAPLAETKPVKLSIERAGKAMEVTLTPHELLPYPDAQSNPSQ